MQCSCYTHSWQEIFTENDDDGGGDNDDGGDYGDCDGNIPYNCHFFYTDTIFVRIKFTPKNADFSR